MKKSKLLLTAFLCAISLMGINAQTISNDGELTDCQSISGDYTVPSNVKTIGEFAFYGASLRSVTIPASVMTIKNHAFLNCPNLEQVTIQGEGLKTIGQYAFSDCLKLTTINLPNSLITLGHGVFWLCEKLENITIGNRLEIIGPHAFQGNVELREIYLPKSLKSIRYNAFAGCKNLSEIELLGVDSIGEKAFFGCKYLKSLDLPEGVKYLGDSIFMRCPKMKSLNIPSSVDFIGCNLFAQSPNFTAYHVVESNPNFKDIDGVLYSKDETILYNVPAQYQAEKYIIPTSVKELKQEAFDGCMNVRSILIPTSVSKIGAGALSYNGAISFDFQGNQNYKLINGGIYEIQNGNPSRLIAYPSANPQPLIVPEGVREIAPMAGKGMNGTDKILLPSTLIKIDSAAFYLNTTILKVGCRATNPPKIVPNPFLNFGFNTLSKGTLFVPNAEQKNYSQTDGWTFFRNIEALDEIDATFSPEDSVKIKFRRLAPLSYEFSGAAGEIYSVYDANGNRCQIGAASANQSILFPSTGVYIIRINQYSYKINVL